MNGTATTNTHPKALEAAAKAAAKRLEDAKKKAFVADCIKQGMRFITSGRHTIAYVEAPKNMVMVATAVRHTNDRDSKLEGRFTAAQHFAQGHFIMVKKDPAFAARPIVESMFFYTAGLQ